MSMHKEPFLHQEEQGLVRHGLKVGTPSQLSDSFRSGFRYALHEILATLEASQTPENVEAAAYLRLVWFARGPAGL